MKIRLHYLDALRGFAIIMMLQGHFVYSMLDLSTIEESNALYQFWKYCRGFTAPLFFTISGWVITFLLIKNQQQGLKNPRIKKGLKRFVELLFWGYLVRLNLPMLFQGKINDSFLRVDVLQIIACGLLFIILIYCLFHFLKKKIGWIYLIIGILIFIYEPLYKDLEFNDLHMFFASYLTQANGGVFYILPWLGYVSIGAFFGCFLSINFVLKDLVGASLLAFGLLIINKSSSFFIWIDSFWEIQTVFYQIAYNNYLFIRLGDVFLLVGVFMLFEKFMRQKSLKFVGTKTLVLYVVHYFILFGSLSGIGLQKLFPKSLNSWQVAIGAILFILLCIGIVYGIDKLKRKYHEKISSFFITRFLKL
ncbi:MAG: heparan-alpha-glucosaminide N-acetyltransferase domain-containing protein [Flavobacteriaceae bacterium]|nr:heparan-alpha-glucosaminide N-acetyltransferase domain-containing protein [Flavobacteriaceae bacterium]MCY4266305.1 heparan-alpha-glucosaminide N-acetyltransferase domain-containing protein [Flavobacteriaceae bacterium]